MTNWPAPNVWVFIAQMVEHCSANAEAMGSNPVEVPKILCSLLAQLLKLQLSLQRSYLHLTIFNMRDVPRSDYSSLQSFIGWRGHFGAQPDGHGMKVDFCILIKK